MDVEAAAGGGCEHGFGQDEAVSGDDRGMEAQRAEAVMLGLVPAQPGRRVDRKAEPFRFCLDGAGSHRLPAARRAGRLAVDGGDLVSGAVQRP